MGTAATSGSALKKAAPTAPRPGRHRRAALAQAASALDIVVRQRAQAHPPVSPPVEESLQALALRFQLHLPGIAFLFDAPLCITSVSAARARLELGAQGDGSCQTQLLKTWVELN